MASGYAQKRPWKCKKREFIVDNEEIMELPSPNDLSKSVNSVTEYVNTNKDLTSASIFDSDDVNFASERAMYSNRNIQRRFAHAAWKQWATERNTMCFDDDYLGHIPLLDEMDGVSEERFSELVKVFRNEARRKDGKPYNVSTLPSLLQGVQYYLTERGYPYADVAGKQRPTSTEIRVLKMQRANVQHIITGEIEEDLWQKDILSLETGQGLTNAVYFYNCKVFGIFGENEHRYLRQSDYTVGNDEEGDFIHFKRSRIDENQSGGKDGREENETICQYDNPNNPRSVYKIFSQYLASVSACSAPASEFYLYWSDTSTSFAHKGVPIGKSTLQKYLPNMMKRLGHTIDSAMYGPTAFIPIRKSAMMLKDSARPVNDQHDEAAIMKAQLKYTSMLLDSPPPPKLVSMAMKRSLHPGPSSGRPEKQFASMSNMVAQDKPVSLSSKHIDKNLRISNVCSLRPPHVSENRKAQRPLRFSNDGDDVSTEVSSSMQVWTLNEDGMLVPIEQPEPGRSTRKQDNPVSLESMAVKEEESGEDCLNDRESVDDNQDVQCIDRDSQPENQGQGKVCAKAKYQIDKTSKRLRGGVIVDNGRSDAQRMEYFRDYMNSSTRINFSNVLPPDRQWSVDDIELHINQTENGVEFQLSVGYK